MASGNPAAFDRRIAVFETPPGAGAKRIDAGALIRNLGHTGVVLLRGFQEDLDTFEAFTRRFCSHFYPTASRSGFRLGEGDGFSTTTPPQNILLLAHSEGAFRPFQWPDVGFFHCIESPVAAGGETTLFDGREFYRRLPAALIEDFTRKGITYESRWPRERWQAEFRIREPGDMRDIAPRLPDLEYRFEGDEMLFRCHGNAIRHLPGCGPVFVNAVLGHLSRITHPGYADSPVYCVPTNRVLFGDGEEIPDSVINTLIDIQDEICLEFSWRDNDLLILDNLRYLHGRRPTVEDCERRIAVRFGYLGPESRLRRRPVT
jgi:alpha-ketoglutarate-dependent taurine dioxygenase